MNTFRKLGGVSGYSMVGRKINMASLQESNDLNYGSKEKRRKKT